MPTKRRDSARSAKPDPSGQLSRSEIREVEERRPPRAAVIFETIRRDGDEELNRPALSLAFSGLAAGMSMGFSLGAMGILRAMLPDASWRPLVESFGYTVGFVIVILGRQQLFTENTLTAVLPLLDSPDKLKTLVKIARLWAIVLAANIAGAFVFALVAAHTDAFAPAVRTAFASIAHQSIAGSDFGSLLVRAVFAGWLIALVIWLMPSAEQSRPLILVLITYVVGIGGFAHIVAGSVEVLYLVVIGHVTFLAYAAGFALPVFLGNVIGGVAFVAMLNYGQVVAEAHG